MKKVSAISKVLKPIVKFATLILLMSLCFLHDIKAQPPCMGMPQAGNIIAFQNPVCPGVSFVLILNPIQSGTTFQWLSSSNGINFNPIPGANAQQLLTSQLQSTYYGVTITCTQSGMSTSSVPLLVTMDQPVIQYPATTVQLSNGESTHPDNIGYVTFSSPCCQGSVTYSDATTSDCCQLVIIRTWSIVDCYGYLTTYVQTITVLLDVSAPVITCGTLGPGACNTTPSPNSATVTVSDQCPGTLTVTSSTAAGPGCVVVTTFTWTATDQCGHSATCTQTTSAIMDTEPPVITCPGPVSLPCNTTPTPSASLISATDNCGTPSISLLGTSSSTVGCTTTFVFSWRATDACGNFADCDQILTSIFDEINPVIHCPNPVDLPCNTTPTPSVGLISATDNCGTPEISFVGSSSSTSGCFVTYVFIWRATDACGNIADCAQILTSVHDLTPPVITCPVPDTFPCNLLPFIDPSLISATDNCGTPVITFIDSRTSSNGCWVTSIDTWKATDACGNFSFCDKLTTALFDAIAPEINCNNPVSIDCNTVPTPDATDIEATDNCGVAPEITLVGSSSSTIDCVKKFVFTWRATDACGNYRECDQILTSIFDDIKPFIECPEPVLLPCNTTPVPNPSLITIADNCNDPFITLQGTGISDIGCLRIFELTWRATDDCGNFSECTQVYFSDFDIIPPVITCPAPDTLCNVTPSPSVSLISATDNCGFVDITLVGTTTSTTGCITTHYFTWKATDVCGNMATCVQVIYAVDDLINPVINDCPSSYMSFPNEEGLCGAFVSWTPPTATDNCGLVSFIGSHTPNTFFPVGETVVTYTATDICGHIKICSFIIKVYDWEPPWNMNCPGVIIQDNDPGLCSAIVTWTVTATDNCGIFSIVSVPASGSVFPVGVTPVLVTATDVNGNTWTCSFNVHVNDNEKPVFVNCPGDYNLDTDPGECTASLIIPTPDATDNCEVESVILITPFITDYPVGVTNVKYKATDIHGNFQICSVNVTVTDNKFPVINNCPADIDVDNDPTLCKAEVTWIEPTAEDNCEILSFIRSHAPGSDFPVGNTTVTYTATDIHGNITICEFDVDVDDEEDPFILSHDIVTCDTIVFYDFIIGDNCLIDELAYIPPSGSVFQPGTTTLVYVEAWDIYDNFNFKYFNVTVLVPPSEIDSVIPSSNEICLGDSVTITAYFDTLGTGGVIKIYKDFCSEDFVVDNSSEADNVWTLKVKPSATGVVTYYIRIEGYCDTTECFPVSFTVNPCSVTLNLKVLLEGFYSGGGLMDNGGAGGNLFMSGTSLNPLDADSIFVSAMDPTPPYAEVDRQFGILKTNGDVTVTFGPAVVPDNFYYLKVNHRNSVETWSAAPVFLTVSTTYSFCSATTQAYLSNEIMTFDALYAAIYTGDINQDNTVDVTDFLFLDPEIQAGLFGYYDGDLNGDGAVDASDFLVLDPNILLGVGAAIP